MTTTRECGHCCQDNPATATLCTFCTEPLDSPDPIQEADLQDPTTREEHDMARTEGNSRAERRANVQALRQADAALHADQRREKAAGIKDETPEYQRLDAAASQAAAKVSTWRGGTRRGR